MTKRVKYICDVCGEDMSQSGNTISHERVTMGKYALKVIATAFVGENKDVCKYCIIQAVNILDDRPKLKEKEND
jgi:hypothetical protein